MLECDRKPEKTIQGKNGMKTTAAKTTRERHEYKERTVISLLDDRKGQKGHLEGTKMERSERRQVK